MLSTITHNRYKVLAEKFTISKKIFAAGLINAFNSPNPADGKPLVIRPLWAKFVNCARLFLAIFFDIGRILPFFLISTGNMIQYHYRLSRSRVAMIPVRLTPPIYSLQPSWEAVHSQLLVFSA